jgi:type III secretion protein U
MKMSMRDIRQEMKDDEGDPHVKGRRREMHQEWANQNAVGAAGGAAALLVNPTHIAIALDYNDEDCPVPVISGRGQGALAAAMRAEAERNNVPIIRNIATARRLWARGEVGEMVPEDMFDAIAEIILWAKKAQQGDAPLWQDMDNTKHLLNPA